MAGIINAFTWLINTIKTLFSMLMNIFETIGMCFNYIISIINIVINIIATLPTWLKAFATITLAISVAYFLIGREAGKSE